MLSREIQLTVAFLIAFALLLLNSVLSLQAVRSLIASNQWVSHSYEVRMQLREVFSLVKDAEIGQRGYLITGDERYLEPYNEALPKINAAADQLQSLTADNENQQTRLIALREKIKNKIAELQETVELQRTKGFTAAQSIVLTGRGKTEMDDLRRIIQEMRDEELILFSRRTEETQGSERLAILTLLIGGLLNLGLVGFLYVYIRRDFERRTRTAEALRVSQKFTQATLNSLESHVAVIDSGGNILIINEAWNNFVEKHSEDLCALHDTAVKLNYRELYQRGMKNSPDDLEIVVQGVMKVLSGGENHFSFVYPCETKTEELWFLMTVTPLRTDKHGAVISQTDITKLKSLEKEREGVLQLEQAARTELENASRAKDEFIATVSHELRTPLNAILGWSALLKDEESDSDTKLRAVETIERNARAQAQLIEDLLDISRIIAGKLELEIRPVNPADVLNATFDAVHLAAQAKQIEIRKSFDESGFLIAGDSSRLQQIFWNLLLNAIKFTPEGGIIKVSLEKTARTAKFIIADNGVGIEPEFLPRIFERFRQADGTTTRRHGGLGLGLAIVKNLVELHGGTAKIRAQPLLSKFRSHRHSGNLPPPKF